MSTGKGSTRITRRLRSIACCSAVAATALIGAAPAAAEPPEQTVTLTPPGPATWNATDPAGNGLNQDYDAATGEPCGDAIADNCDTILLHANMPGGFWDTQGGVVEVTIDNFTAPPSDFDLYVYESDAAGTRGDLIDDSAGLPGSAETAEIPEADGYYLVQVVYFQVIASSYQGHATIVTRPDPPPDPPDVDNPAGLQDVLASNPGLGYRSHSEPHIAQSPINPNLLIAASKQYNRDPDSLDEYEFKIGSYVSFDRGRSWTDLGQTNVCPLGDAPPDSWPDNHCYPEDIPGQQGTGDEDAGVGPRAIDLVPEKYAEAIEEMQEEAGIESEGGRKPWELEGSPAQQRGNDYGEEYITSDTWIQFDDEGNAYMMVLDSPPYDHGNGWGMSFHRWETPSQQDVFQSHDTWSNRIPINSYSQDVAPFFLDDKNTFAVNNAGPDKDGQTGPIVACWGQNVPDAIKQQTVCERSTDGGKTWPGSPTPISGPQQLVIGVSVVADTQNPNRFYATWLHYTGQVAGTEAEYWFAQSLDGGATWSPPTLITQVHGLPSQFPGNAFRNLSIPIMAAGPSEGQLYITYAEYLPATGAGDFDGMQADVRLLRSTNGGLTWTMPMTVNPDPASPNHDPDQFQPTVAVTPNGQVNIAYFDRRQDPDNFYIDTYLSRSNDGGMTFTPTRVSHDMWDPRINPPTSPSGAFIGDYQGLVADNCVAVPFFNDTHLANDAGRDPDFDDGQARSPYQEAISWRVPNTAQFGGQPVPGTDCTAAPLSDFDGDGVGDSQDQCPGQVGSASNGCPPGSGPGAGAPAGRGGAAGAACSNRIAGSRGSNRLRGTPQSDRLLGRRGNDKLFGGAGPDCLFGGPGNDRIKARDGERDVVRCGRDVDFARVDKIDSVRGCETKR